MRTIVLRFLLSAISLELFAFILSTLVSNKSKYAPHIEKVRWTGYLLLKTSESDSQLAQDLWVAYRMNSKKEGFFVEVGACHPKYLSNTHLLENKLGWKGILIEPNPNLVNRLRQERTAQVVECAIAQDDFVELKIATNPEFSSINSQLSRTTHRLYEFSGKSIFVQAKRLDEVLKQVDCPSVFDYLSVDIEGGELFAIESLNFNLFSPKLISIEHNFSNSRFQIQELLLSNGYVLDPLSSKWSWDDWYVRRDFLDTEMKITF